MSMTRTHRPIATTAPFDTAPHGPGIVLAGHGFDPGAVAAALTRDVARPADTVPVISEEYFHIRRDAVRCDITDQSCGLAGSRHAHFSPAHEGPDAHTHFTTAQWAREPAQTPTAAARTPLRASRGHDNEPTPPGASGGRTP